MKNQTPRILVIGVAAWNSKIGANTWQTLLKNHKSENVANIYIRNEVPDSDVASRYFCISENKIIKSLLKRSVKTGFEVTPEIENQENSDLKAHNERYKKMQKKRRYSMLLAREIIWKLGAWKTRELDDFLDSFKPDIILHSMEGYIHLNRIIEYAINRTGAKAIGYIWDDNFTYKQCNDFGYKFYRYFQRKSLKKLAAKTQEFFAITPKTRKEADEFFGIHSILLTKPLNSILATPFLNANKPFRMLYTGNLNIGRDASLEKVSKALNQINKDETKIILDVYTKTFLSEEKIKNISSSFCTLNEPIPQEEVLKLQKQADILLFLEDIDGKDAKVARLSFSTKITDYLSSGKCIFAVGNEDIAPIQYLKDNDCAIVACTELQIAEALGNMQAERLKQCAENAVKCGLENHNKENIINIFDEVLYKVFKTQAN